MKISVILIPIFILASCCRMPLVDCPNKYFHVMKYHISSSQEVDVVLKCDGSFWFPRDKHIARIDSFWVELNLINEGPTEKSYTYTVDSIFYYDSELNKSIKAHPANVLLNYTPEKKVNHFSASFSLKSIDTNAVKSHSLKIYLSKHLPNISNRNYQLNLKLEH